MDIKTPDQIIHVMIQSKDFFPGNPRFPLLIYKGALNLLSDSSNARECYEADLQLSMIAF